MSKNVVFIVNLQEEYHKGQYDPSRRERSIPFEYSIKSWQYWCDKNDHELFVLTERIHDGTYMNANWHKAYVFELLEANDIDYDQILIADADTLIHPDAPDIFDMSEGKLCAVQNWGYYDWVHKSIYIYKQQFFPDIDIKLSEYFNSGIMIVNKHHKPLYNKVLEFYTENQESLVELQNTVQLGTDQPVLNFMVKQQGIDVKMLSYEWNAQSLRNFGMLIIADPEHPSGAISDEHVDLGYIFHFNGLPDSDRMIFMEATYDYMLKRETHEN